ncbi:MAG: nucleoside triphosphate pyrophosphohydrolase [Ruminococcaceae bacterium]|nr:nucleoside triphosphate pyrophosphohydrolase [Oscillospiraceae bacterium]
MTAEEKISVLLDKDEYGFDDLVMIMEVLRSEQGCPWDREQTHKSIRKDLIEETYEVIEAIDTDDPVLLREELGDLLLQIVFHARIEEEKDTFDINDVAGDVCKKLIHRHPHVFGEVVVENTDNVLSNWEKIKSEEKSRVTVTDKLRAIPPMLPALMRAEKVGKKAKCFDFADSEEVMDKVCEELAELSEAVNEGSAEEIEEEIGDLLLTVTSLCRKLKIDPELALSKATDKFIDRFEQVEGAVLSCGKDIDTVSNEELNRIWDENKHKNSKKN